MRWPYSVTFREDSVNAVGRTATSSARAPKLIPCRVLGFSPRHVAAIDGMLFGYDTGVISGAILFIRPDFGLGTARVELVVSAALVGATVGAIGSARLTDALGRRTVLLAAAGCFGVGAIAASLAPSVGVLVAARLLLGLAIGVSSYAVPLCIARPLSRHAFRFSRGSWHHRDRAAGWFR
jgi:MFS family permease